MYLFLFVVQEPLFKIHELRAETRLRSLYVFCNTIADDHCVTKGITLHPKNDTIAFEI